SSTSTPTGRTRTCSRSTWPRSASPSTRASRPTTSSPTPPTCGAARSPTCASTPRSGPPTCCTCGRSREPGHVMSPLTPDDRWYQRAVFYEVFVRGFFDANGDGTGDLRGLTEKLDYLAWLGIDCIWLLPFYQSPLRDGGYDISDFREVHPDYGTVDDVQQLIDAAHARQI